MPASQSDERSTAFYSGWRGYNDVSVSADPRRDLCTSQSTLTTATTLLPNTPLAGSLSDYLSTSPHDTNRLLLINLTALQSNTYKLPIEVKHKAFDWPWHFSTSLRLTRIHFFRSACGSTKWRSRWRKPQSHVTLHCDQLPHGVTAHGSTAICIQ